MNKWWCALTALLLPITAQAQSVPPNTTWYWQLSGTVNTAHAAKVYDIDMEAATSNLIASLKTDGHTVICYIDAGGWEPYRADASQFPKEVIGAKMAGWNENYLDIRSATVRNLMGARMDAAKAKGCNGLEPDVVDSYLNNTGFPLTKADQVDYLKFWSTAGHQRGLLVALKNDAELVSTVVGYFDFAIAEECFTYSECPSYSPFVKANKAVLVAEYTRSVKTTWCSKAKTLKFSLAYYNLDLDGRRYLLCP